MTESVLTTVDCVVLASGSSTRMGSNKLLLPLEGRTVIECVLETFSKVGFQNIVVVTADPEIERIVSHYRVTLCHNALSSDGKSSAIRLGIEHCSIGSGILFAVADQPLLRVQTLKGLLQSFRNDPEKIVVPLVDGGFANPVIFPRRFHPQLLALTGDLGGKEVIHSYPEEVNAVPCSCPEEFQDIDTPEEYQKILARLSREQKKS